MINDDMGSLIYALSQYGSNQDRKLLVQCKHVSVTKFFPFLLAFKLKVMRELKRIRSII